MSPADPTLEDRLLDFVAYSQRLDGNEKSEAQVFLDRLFQAFGHKGYKEAGATLETRIRRTEGKRTTAFADLTWQPRLLLEMKCRSEPLERHLPQARGYWHDIYPKPKYVVLCNFDEFRIYDFNTQSDPVDIVPLVDLPRRYSALNFFLPEERKPVFQTDSVEVSREAARKLAELFHSIVRRKAADRSSAQRFVLQCVLALFSEDFQLLPRGLFSEIVQECHEGASTFDLIGALFRQMNQPKPAAGGRFKEVMYFDGGLFSAVDPIDLTAEEVGLLHEACKEDWAFVQPAIFGSLFEASMDQGARHATGAHFTSEADILKIIRPTIEKPLLARLDKAKNYDDLVRLRRDLSELVILDPACGCGNFLYVAYRELRRIERLVIEKMLQNARRRVVIRSYVKTSQFHGIDKLSFAVELAKVTLMLAKEQAWRDTFEWTRQQFLKNRQLGMTFDDALPLDNLDQNIVCDDALFCAWPKASIIIGNPPYQAKNNQRQELGDDYMDRLRSKYPDVPGRADYCVYWFRRAHDELPPNGRAGLVGTNTIRQNYSREGGLDYIVANGGTIIEAVSSQEWSGDAGVHVSIVNWVKGSQPGPKILVGDVGPTSRQPTVYRLATISAQLSFRPDVTSARDLKINELPKVCFQGQTTGYDAEGFVLDRESAAEFLRVRPDRDVVFPFLDGDTLVGAFRSQPMDYCFDLGHCADLTEAARYPLVLAALRKRVLPRIEQKAAEESRKSKPYGRRLSHLNDWWRFLWHRADLIRVLSGLSRYIACSRNTRRPIFEFISPKIRPKDLLTVFTFQDDYSFGILQSNLHWEWFNARCSTLRQDYRYTTETVFSTFPWPQDPDAKQVQAIAASARELRNIRKRILEERHWSLRELYSSLELPGKHPLRDAHEQLDQAVRRLYGMKRSDDPLDFLLALNRQVHEREVAGKEVQGPGLVGPLAKLKDLVSSDCISPDLWV